MADWDVSFEGWEDDHHERWEGELSDNYLSEAIGVFVHATDAESGDDIWFWTYASDPPGDTFDAWDDVWDAIDDSLEGYGLDT